MVYPKLKTFKKKKSNCTMPPLLKNRKEKQLNRIAQLKINKNANHNLLFI